MFTTLLLGLVTALGATSDSTSTPQADKNQPGDSRAFARLFQPQESVSVDVIRPRKNLPRDKHPGDSQDVTVDPGRAPRVFRNNYGLRGIEGPKIVCGLKVWQVDPAIDAGIRVQVPAGDFKIRRIDPPRCSE